MALTTLWNAAVSARCGSNVATQAEVCIRTHHETSSSMIRAVDARHRRMVSLHAAAISESGFVKWKNGSCLEVAKWASLLQDPR